MKTRHILLIFALLLAGFVAPPTGEPATTLGPASFVAPKDKALVVFVRNSRLGKAINFYILDENKKFLTMLRGNQHVTATLEPGQHTLYVISENAGLVRADLGAGRTYIIETRPKMGFGKARVIVEPVLRNTDRFAESAKWVRDTKPASPDLADGAKWVRKHQDVVNERIKKAEQEWSKGDEKYRASLSMAVEDGRTEQEALKL